MGRHVPTQIDVSQVTALILVVLIVAAIAWVAIVVRRGRK